MTGFSKDLRARTQDAHTAAERRRFITDLMGGALDPSAYAALLVELRRVYATLEAAEDRVAGEPRLAPFLDPALRRSDAIAADLAALGEHPGQPARCAATLRYCAHIDEAADRWPVSFLGHHYTRMLGDLAGGQIIAVMMRRHYGLQPEQLTMLAFAEAPKRIADRYRAALDEVDLTPDERDAVVAESQRAYTCNADIFDELGGRFAPLAA
jgi:heme oxygenase (biliverdin-producing, ferredoxin)